MFKIYELAEYCRDNTYQLDVLLADRPRNFKVKDEHLKKKEPSPEVASYLSRLYQSTELVTLPFRVSTRTAFEENVKWGINVLNSVESRVNNLIEPSKFIYRTSLHIPIVHR